MDSNVNITNFSPEKAKKIMTVNALEKEMRKHMRDIRRFKPKLEKATRNYINHAKNMEIKQKTLKALENRRDSLLKEIIETSNT